ncbi:helix-turn-helix domain-containing protein [Jiella pelagia]|uniref:helix-turn-helix domain-containing protein n=1 Tax=Jiella pelagia TaxID=2986949 RepID=UPI002E372D4B|nr:helix-turn-helix domain-containing protein [Jiella pelagia]
MVLSESETLGIIDFPQIEALMAAGSGERAGVARASHVRHAFDRPMLKRVAPYDTIIEREDFPSQLRREAPVTAEFPLRDGEGQVRRIVEVEADLIRMAVAQYDGRMSEIARRLGIGRSTLYRKMREYKIEDRG